MPELSSELRAMSCELTLSEGAHHPSNANLELSAEDPGAECCLERRIHPQIV